GRGWGSERQGRAGKKGGPPPADPRRETRRTGGGIDWACQAVADADDDMRPSRPCLWSPFAKCGVTLASEASPSERADRLSGNALGPAQLCRRTGNVDLALLAPPPHPIS